MSDPVAVDIPEGVYYVQRADGNFFAGWEARGSLWYPQDAFAYRFLSAQSAQVVADGFNVSCGITANVVPAQQVTTDAPENTTTTKLTAIPFIVGMLTDTLLRS